MLDIVDVGKENWNHSRMTEVIGSNVSELVNKTVLRKGNALNF